MLNLLRAVLRLAKEAGPRARRHRPAASKQAVKVGTDSRPILMLSDPDRALRATVPAVVVAQPDVARSTR